MGHGWKNQSKSKVKTLIRPDRTISGSDDKRRGRSRGSHKLQPSSITTRDRATYVRPSRGDNKTINPVGCRTFTATAQSRPKSSSIKIINCQSRKDYQRSWCYQCYQCGYVTSHAAAPLSLPGSLYMEVWWGRFSCFGHLLGCIWEKHYLWI